MQFDVLNHAGFTLSYTAAIRKIKELSQERLLEIVGLVGCWAFMIIWDNLNIAFWVGKQCKASKDYFDNGTTTTLIPLYDIKFSSLPLNLKPPCDNQQPVVDLIMCSKLSGGENNPIFMLLEGVLKVSIVLDKQLVPHATIRGNVGVLKLLYSFHIKCYQTLL